MTAQQSYLPTCDPRLTPFVALRSYPFTPRRAVDISGRLGMLYDASRDQILHISKLDLPTQSLTSQGSAKCWIQPYEKDEFQSPLKWYNIHPELRVSVALEMIPATGIGELFNYSRKISKYTRFIHYSYLSRTEFLSDHNYNSRNTTNLSMLDTQATHVIVLVNWSVTAVAVLELPHEDELVKNIDGAIQNLCTSLSRDNHTSDLPKDDQNYLEKITYTKVFSNVVQLSKINSMIDFYRDILRLKNNTDLHQPYNYNLCSLQHFFRRTDEKYGTFMELQNDYRDELENYLLELSSNLKKLTRAINREYPNLRQHLKQYLDDMLRRWSNLKKMYKHEIERLQSLIIDIRRKKVSQNKLHEALDGNERKELNKNIEDFTSDLNVLQEKEDMIGYLLQKDFKYKNAIVYDIKKDDNEQILEKKISADINHVRIIYSNDNLYKNNKSQWYTLYTQLLTEREKNPDLQFIYLDFSDCLYELDHFITFPTLLINHNNDAPKPTSTPPSEQLENNEIINILLIGESGVGKSTFINALVNYLQFNTLEQAQKKPIVLMPISFVMTVDDDFKEKLVTFCGEDNVSNEDYDNPGQSVTQHCKSYILTLAADENRKRIKLRIIDTPGIGDVRGVTQDDVNMQHILSFINNLTHLNAICILMKPNNTRLNIYFRSCFMQLFDFLGENARDKILFCFTNTRLTFYTPGDTSSLLKKLLESLPGKKVSLTKQNTFCFDSESFRYLVAVQNDIKFDNDQKEDYKDSWNRSSTESKRFLKYISTEMSTPFVPSDTKSMKHAQLKIHLMIRPILEAMRNILRNIILQETQSPSVSIELSPKITKVRTTICSQCSYQHEQFGGFWIRTDSLHVFYNRCRTCSCDSQNHYPIDYELRYKLCQYPPRDSIDNMKNMLDDICKTSTEFSQILFEAIDKSSNDPFLSGFERMIKEEGDICTQKTSYNLNFKLMDELQQLKEKYEDSKKQMTMKKTNMTVSDMYDKIENISKCPMIESQMAAVNQWEKYMVKYYEYEVPIYHKH